MLERGYQYFDWNVLAGDSEPRSSGTARRPGQIVSNVLSEANSSRRRILPFACSCTTIRGKNTTTEALPRLSTACAPRVRVQDA